MATLTGKITDVTGRAPDSISSITVKAPSVRIGSGTDVIVSSPAEVTFDKTTGDITISGLTGGLSWLYIEGDGWSDSIALAVAEGMITLVEAVANAAGVPGLADYIRLLVELETRIDDIAQDAVDAAAENIIWYKGLVPAGTASLDDLSDGAWGVASASVATNLGLPGTLGTIQLVTAGTGSRTAEYISQASASRPLQIWINSRSSSSGWAGWESPSWVKTALSITSPNVKELPVGAHPVPSAAVARAVGLPVEAGGTVIVLPLNADGRKQIEYRRGFGGVGEVWSISHQASGEWGDWVKGGGAETSKHEILVSDLKARRGGRKITKGGAVSFVVDHGTNRFNEVYLPMLRARGMAATIALCSDMYNPDQYRYEFDNRTDWGIVKGWYENDGIEIANHGRTHGTTSEAGAYEEIVGGLEELKAALHGVPIDSFVNHAGLGSGMPDYGNGKDIEVFYETVAGRLIHEHHACIVSGTTSQTFPLMGDPYVGVYRYWVETSSQINTAKTAIQNAISRNHGVVISIHPELMDGGRRATDAEFEAFLDWMKSFIDEGELTMLTLRDMMVSEYSADRNCAGTGSPEGEVSAPVGTVYTDTEATNGAVRWIKTSGTGNTGWHVEYGDTGWRDITDRSDAAESGTIFLRRSGNTVSLVFTDVQLSTRSEWQYLVSIPNGFRPDIRIDHRPMVASEVTTLIMNYPVGQYRSSGHESSADPLTFRDMWETDETWPSSLPGTPV